MGQDTAALAFAAMIHARESARAAEVAEIVALLEASEAYDVEEDPELSHALQPKRVSSGRDGVRGPGEAFVLEAAAATGMSFSGMRERISQALSIRLRHPRMWELFVSGGLPWWVAVKIEDATKPLSRHAAHEVDRRAAHWLGMNTFWTLLDQLSVWVAAADRQLAEKRVRIAAQERFVHVGRFEDDHVGVYGRVAAHDGVRFDQALDQIARGLPEPEAPTGLEPHERARFIRGQRRAAAFGIFTRQAIGQDSLMDVEVVVHVPAQHPTPDVSAPLGTTAYVEGWGRLLSSSLPVFLSGSKVTVRPVIDPHLVPDARGYEPSRTQRLALAVRNPRSVFPFSSTPARRSDIDHTVAFQPTGRQGLTSMRNLGPLERTAHRAKTAGHWRLTQPRPGVFHWKSPLGYQYLVTGRGSTMTRAPDLPVAPIPDLPARPPLMEPPPDEAAAA